MGAQDILKKFELDYSKYEQIYKDLHANPGLSNAEEYASKTAAGHLEKLGYKVTRNIGGYGVLGVLENGEGKVVMSRADTDALAIEERTGLPYASKVKQKDPSDGVVKSVMHGCGHDFHTAWLMGCCELMINTKDQWKGTHVAVFQPAEEAGTGARGMVKDGLYDKAKINCPIPDVVLAQHVMPLLAGNVYTPHGVVLTTSDCLDIIIHGKGAHSSQPSSAVNPVTIASHAATQIQEIPSTFVKGTDTVICTVTSIQGGVASNVIPDTAVMKVNIRTNEEEARNSILAAIERIVKSQCQIYLTSKEPEIVNSIQMPLLTNGDDETNITSKAFQEYFGDKHSDDPPQFMASEDASELASAVGKNICFWFVGGTSQKLMDDTNGSPPFNHSSDFAPCIHPTLKTGCEAMSLAVLTHLQG